jgi:hypothetical protein
MAHKATAPPGSPGWSPTQGPHRPARADFPHAVLRVSVLLTQFRYPLLSRVHDFRLHRILRVSHQRFRLFHDGFLPSAGSLRVWFAGLLGTMYTR